MSTGDKVFALVVGVSDYSILDHSRGSAPGTSRLRGADNDAHAVARLIRMMDVPAENLRVLTTPQLGPNDFSSAAVGRASAPAGSGEPSVITDGVGSIQPVELGMFRAQFGPAYQADILAGLRWLAGKLEATEGAQGIVYFSGHGLLTEAGHICLCPADTRAGEAPGSSVDVAGPDAVHRYMHYAALLSALDEVTVEQGLGPLGRLVESIVGHGEPPEGVDVAEFLWVCADAAGLSVDEDGLRRCLEHISILRDNDTERRMRASARYMLAYLCRHPPTPEVIADVMLRDPFADAAELRGLISFNKMSYQLFRDVPEDRSIVFLLDACMGSKGRRLHSQYTHDGGSFEGEPVYRTGLPQAHPQSLHLLACMPGHDSYRAVFGDRWHGAFTWALVTLLERTPVSSTGEGRHFELSYADLQERVAALLGAFGVPQRPDLWFGAMGRPERWPVFGRQVDAPPTGRLLPVLVRQELSAGNSGRMFSIVDMNDNGIGWLVLVAGSDVTVWAGQPAQTTLHANHEYWLWDDPGNAFPDTGFKLRRPPAVPQGNPSLKALVEANPAIQSVLANRRVTSSKDFQAYSGGASGGHRAFQIYQPGESQPKWGLVLPEPPPNKLRWYRKDGSAPKANLGNLSGAELTLPPSKRVEFRCESVGFSPNGRIEEDLA